MRRHGQLNEPSNSNANSSLLGDVQPTEQLIDEAIVLHYGEWILMKVTGFDDHKEPHKGIVLAHSPSRDEVSQVLRTQPLRSTLPPDAPYQPYYTFKAFQRARVGETVEQASVRFAALRATLGEGRRGQRRP